MNHWLGVRTTGCTACAAMTGNKEQLFGVAKKSPSYPVYVHIVSLRNLPTIRALIHRLA
ncbi:hypothetical protein PT2222_10079 [Paraburkholderia tropica]